MGLKGIGYYSGFQFLNDAVKKVKITAANVPRHFSSECFGEFLTNLM